jgi:AsmA protein
MRFRELATELAVGDGRAALSSVQTQLYGGGFTGGVEIDATGATPSIHLRGTATALAMDPLFIDMLGASSLSGTGNFDLDLRGLGATIGEAMATAAGTMGVSFTDGELRGVNLGHGLCKAMNTFRQLPEPPPAPDATPFSLIRASSTVADGTATTQDLFVSTGYLELTGQGSIRLVDQTLDTTYVARMVGPVNLPGCERLNSRVDGSIPIGFSLVGPVSSPTPAFDVRQLAEDLIRREIRNQAEDAVRDRIQDALRGAFE